jgi:acetylornithine deacetylase/succinyl-diaminopimelate desuccinylase-like protein
MCCCCLWEGVVPLRSGADLGDDGAHSTNEKLDLSNYVSGIKLLGAYLHEVATMAE